MKPPLRPAASRCGVTLVELLVVVTLLALSAGIAGLALRQTRQSTDANRRFLLVSRLADARREALRSGRPVTIRHADSGGAGFATAFPDGSIVADALVGGIASVDRLSGKP